MKMSKILIVSSALSLMAFAPSTMAREFADIYTECGLGAMIASNNGAVAAVTNVTWDLGTTAISSNASSPDTCKGGQAETAMLIYEAYPMIERQVAEGHGAHLDALFELRGVEADDRAALTAELRGEFAKAAAEDGFADLPRFDKAERLYDAMNSVLAAHAS